MHSIHQFRPTFYLVMALGLTGFCIAIEAPGLWVFTIATLLLHLWLVATGRFRPMPRLVASLITLLALAYTFHVVRTVPTPIIAIGQFLVLLQGVKLFELRANRDHTQLIVLSLLLMVAGAISTATLAFGVLMIVYLFVALYCCLLFHLKIEHEAALSAQTLPADKVNVATVRQDQRFLARSMKKLAALVATAAMLLAVGVFLFFPRGPGAGLFGQLQFRPGQALTGFSDQVSFGQINSISQSTEIVANVTVHRNGVRLEGTETLYLRGKTLERYNPQNRRWEHMPPIPRDILVPVGEFIDVVPSAFRPPPGDEYHQAISLRPTGTGTLFAMSNPVSFLSARDIGKIRYNLDDQTLEGHSPMYHRLDYEVLSRRTPMPAVGVERPADFAAISPRLVEFARRPEVCGADDEGRPLASLRLRSAAVTQYDEAIAANIERYLRSNFEYTLDLPSQVSYDEVQDPVEQFLFDWKKGHCEYFASAMVLMLQGLGIPSRMVTGFKCDEYDPGMGRYYIVRQSHAHAWVEMRTASGWKAYDPTSGTLSGSRSHRSAWQAVKHFFAFLEFKWATGVVGYDADRRDNLINNLERSAGDSAVRNSNRVARWWRRATRQFDRTAETIRGWFNTGQGQIVSSHLLAGLTAIAVALTASWAVRRLLRRWRMHQRALRIGLEHLPVAERLRLARQLGFYENLMALLERHRIVRPPAMTPAEFCRSLIFLPSHAYDTVRDLTDQFYAIRWGHRELSGTRQRDLETSVQSLEPILKNIVAVR